jgi:hypothetical protein
VRCPTSYSSLISLGLADPLHRARRRHCQRQRQVVQDDQPAGYADFSDSVAVSYVAGGVTYTGTDNSAGVITGDGITGRVNYTPRTDAGIHDAHAGCRQRGERGL